MEATMPVTLINVFSVPKGKENDFVQWWQHVKANITAQQGFISGKFHRSLKPESRYNFINVAVCVTPMKAKLEQLGVDMVPALYNVAFEY
jgi:heme oxygenase (mycobilin-producing)